MQHHEAENKVDNVFKEEDYSLNHIIDEAVKLPQNTSQGGRFQGLSKAGWLKLDLKTHLSHMTKDEIAGVIANCNLASLDDHVLPLLQKFFELMRKQTNNFELPNHVLSQLTTCQLNKISSVIPSTANNSDFFCVLFRKRFQEMFEDLDRKLSK